MVRKTPFSMQEPENASALPSAERAKADYIVTRDKGLLRRSTVCALAPEDATALLRARG